MKFLWYKVEGVWVPLSVMSARILVMKVLCNVCVKHLFCFLVRDKLNDRFDLMRILIYISSEFFKNENFSTGYGSYWPNVGLTEH